LKNNSTLQTILLVEDDAIISMSTELFLKECNFSVVSAYNGEEALDYFTNENEIDLVLMDIDLGEGMDGIKAAGLIYRKRNLPIIFHTSHCLEELLEKASITYPFEYFHKSDSKSRLFDLISNSLQALISDPDIINILG